MVGHAELGIWLEGLILTERLAPVANKVDPQQSAEQLLARATEQGIDLVGPVTGRPIYVAIAVPGPAERCWQHCCAPARP